VRASYSAPMLHPQGPTKAPLRPPFHRQSRTAGFARVGGRVFTRRECLSYCAKPTLRICARNAKEYDFYCLFLPFRLLLSAAKGGPTTNAFQQKRPDTRPSPQLRSVLGKASTACREPSRNSASAARAQPAEGKSLAGSLRPQNCPKSPPEPFETGLKNT